MPIGLEQQQTNKSLIKTWLPRLKRLISKEVQSAFKSVAQHHPDTQSKMGDSPLKLASFYFIELSHYDKLDWSKATGHVQKSFLALIGRIENYYAHSISPLTQAFRRHKQRLLQRLKVGLKSYESMVEVVDKHCFSFKSKPKCDDFVKQGLRLITHLTPSTVSLSSDILSLDHFIARTKQRTMQLEQAFFKTIRPHISDLRDKGLGGASGLLGEIDNALANFADGYFVEKWLFDEFVATYNKLCLQEMALTLKPLQADFARSTYQISLLDKFVDELSHLNLSLYSLPAYAGAIVHSSDSENSYLQLKEEQRAISAVLEKLKSQSLTQLTKKELLQVRARIVRLTERARQIEANLYPEAILAIREAALDRLLDLSQSHDVTAFHAIEMAINIKQRKALTIEYFKANYSLFCRILPLETKRFKALLKKQDLTESDLNKAIQEFLTFARMLEFLQAKFPSQSWGFFKELSNLARLPLARRPLEGEGTRIYTAIIEEALILLPQLKKVESDADFERLDAEPLATVAQAEDSLAIVRPNQPAKKKRRKPARLIDLSIEPPQRVAVVSCEQLKQEVEGFMTAVSEKGESLISHLAEVYNRAGKVIIKGLSKKEKQALGDFSPELFKELAQIDIALASIKDKYATLHEPIPSFQLESIKTDLKSLLDKQSEVRRRYHQVKKGIAQSRLKKIARALESLKTIEAYFHQCFLQIPRYQGADEEAVLAQELSWKKTFDKVISVKKLLQIRYQEALSLDVASPATWLKLGEIRADLSGLFRRLKPIVAQAKPTKVKAQSETLWQGVKQFFGYGATDAVKDHPQIQFNHEVLLEKLTAMRQQKRLAGIKTLAAVSGNVKAQYCILAEVYPDILLKRYLANYQESQNWLRYFISEESIASLLNQSPKPVTLVEIEERTQAILTKLHQLEQTANTFIRNHNLHFNQIVEKLRLKVIKLPLTEDAYFYPYSGETRRFRLESVDLIEKALSLFIREERTTQAISLRERWQTYNRQLAYAEKIERRLAHVRQQRPLEQLSLSKQAIAEALLYEVSQVMLKIRQHIQRIRLILRQQGKDADNHFTIKLLKHLHDDLLESHQHFIAHHIDADIFVKSIEHHFTHHLLENDNLTRLSDPLNSVFIQLLRKALRKLAMLISFITGFDKFDSVYGADEAEADVSNTAKQWFSSRNAFYAPPCRQAVAQDEAFAPDQVLVKS